MKPRFLLFCAALAAAPLLCAQDTKQEMPNPKTKEHEALAAFVGTWQSSGKMAAMPGIPGMEKAQDWTGTEQTELICNGLWLKSTMDSSGGEQSFQGVWLAGYDPIEKVYKSFCVGNHEEPTSIMIGNFDAKSKTWTFKGSCSMGEFRSVLTWKDADNSTELCYAKGPDGKEVEFMNINRKRSTGGAAKDASAKVSQLPASEPASLAKEHSLLAQSVGRWDAVVSHSAAGQPASEEKATEVVTAICGGKWYWSDFKGSMGGQPFTGHGLTGYDATSKQYIGFWIDSSSPHFARTTGTFDAAKNTFTYNGDSIGMDGKPMKISETYSQKDKDTRILDMTFKGADATQQMKITYTRAKS